RLRGADESLVDALLAADAARRAAVSAADALRAEQKTVSREVSQASPEHRHAVLERAKSLADEVKAAEAELAHADAAVRAAHLAIPNVVEDGAPAGGEDDYVVLDVVGTPPAVDAAKDHVEIGASLRAIDTDRGAKVS